MSIKLIVLILVLALGTATGYYLVKHRNLLPDLFHSHSLSRIKLPEPVYHSATSVEEALKARRSLRQYKTEALSLQDVSQLLWAAQGISATNGLRTAPSAGGLYPLEIYLVTGNVKDLPAGIYHYLPEQQSLELLSEGDKREELSKAAHEQRAVANAAADLVITGIYKKTITKYGSQGERYVHMEAGHAAENVYLQAVSLSIGTVSIAGFDSAALRRSLNIPNEEDPLYIMPVGKIGAETK